MKNIAIICILLFSIKSTAQDTNYWTQQFGSKSSLLGGAVVGGVRDNSAIFYNPGAMSLVDSSTVSVSATGYQYESLKLQNGAGVGIDLSSSKTSIIPLIITGTYKFKKNNRHTLGYTIISKMQTGLKFSARNDNELDVLPEFNSEGNEEFVAQYNLNTSVSEQWFGGGYSYRFSDHFSVGLTAFINYRSQILEKSHVARAIPFDTSVYYQYVTQLVSANDIQSIEFMNFNLTNKIGFAFDYGRLKFGFSVTAPGIKLYSSGNYLRDSQLSNMNLDQNNINDYIENAETEEELSAGINNFKDGLYSFTANDKQDSKEGMKVEYKTPLSISGGLEYDFRVLKLSTSWEWFDKIDTYSIITPVEREVLRPKSAKFGYTSTEFMSIKEGNNSVFNWALAFEIPVTQKISLISSFRTDKSYASKPTAESERINQTYWNLKHVTFGAIQKKEKSDLSVGLTYGFGSTTGLQYTNLATPYEANALEGDIEENKINYNTFALLLGYTYYLGK